MIPGEAIPPFATGTQRDLPAIVGSDDTSMLLSGIEPISRPDFPLSGTDQFAIGIDIQPDSTGRNEVLGVDHETGAFSLTVDETRRGDIEFSLKDIDGRELIAHGEGSSAAARRLWVVGHLSRNRVDFYELQPWSARPGSKLRAEVTKAESPRWPASDAGLSIGGVLRNGTPWPSFVGRVGNSIFFFDKRLSKGYASVTDNPTGLSHSKLGPVSREQRIYFQKDLDNLKKWTGHTRSSERDLDEATIILCRWLLDRHPLLLDIAKALGVQLWIPGMSDRERNYLDIVRADSPILQITGNMGMDSPFGYKWSAFSEWRSDPAFHVDGTPISHEAFVWFVANKLGPRHLDEHDRSPLQRTLLSYTDGLTLLGNDSLTFQIQSIARVILSSVSLSRLDVMLSS